MKESRSDWDLARLRARPTDKVSSGPDDPSPAERAAERARRDRRRRLIIGAVVATVVAVVIITPQFLNKVRTQDMRDNVANPPPSNPQAQGVSEPLATTPCPKDLLAIPSDPASSRQTIPEDAVSIRLCPVAWQGQRVAERWLAPADALERGGVETFLRDIAGETGVRPDRCQTIRVAADPFALLVALPDGQVQPVYASNSCEDIFVGPTRHQSDSVLDAYLRSLGKQRSKLGVPSSVPEPSLTCAPGFSQQTMAAPVSLTRGPALTPATRFEALVLCRGDGPQEQADVDVLNRAWPSSIQGQPDQSPRPVDRCRAAFVVWDGAYAVTTWGDVVNLFFYACGNYALGHYQPAGGEAGAAQEIRFLPDDAVSVALGLPHG